MTVGEGGQYPSHLQPNGPVAAQAETGAEISGLCNGRDAPGGDKTAGHADCRRSVPLPSPATSMGQGPLPELSALQQEAAVCRTPTWK
jgi:hypothetical protein